MSGNNVLYGGDATAILMGGSGHDVLVGGNGDDFIFAGSGGDRLEGQAGTNYLKGGVDADVFVFSFDNGQNDRAKNELRGTIGTRSTGRK